MDEIADAAAISSGSPPEQFTAPCGWATTESVEVSESVTMLAASSSSASAPSPRLASGSVSPWPRVVLSVMVTWSSVSSSTFRAPNPDSVFPVIVEFTNEYVPPPRTALPAPWEVLPENVLAFAVNDESAKFPIAPARPPSFPDRVEWSMVIVESSSVSMPPPPSDSAVLSTIDELVTWSSKTPVAPLSTSRPSCSKAPPQPSAVLPENVEPSMVTVATSESTWMPPPSPLPPLAWLSEKVEPVTVTSPEVATPPPPELPRSR